MPTKPKTKPRPSLNGRIEIDHPPTVVPAALAEFNAARAALRAASDRINALHKQIEQAEAEEQERGLEEITAERELIDAILGHSHVRDAWTRRWSPCGLISGDLLFLAMPMGDVDAHGRDYGDGKQRTELVIVPLASIREVTQP
jgi:hypothetical protein